MIRARSIRRAAFGDSGLRPALVLGGVALITSFITVAGARALVSADNTATTQALGQLPAIDRGVQVSGDFTAWPSTGVLKASRIVAAQAGLAASLPDQAFVLRGQGWAAASLRASTVTNAPPKAILSVPPQLELTYRTGMARYARVLTGSFPQGDAVVSQGGTAMTFPVALTQAVAERFGARVGSVLDLSPASEGDPRLFLRVTGILQPADAGSSFWQISPEFATPSLEAVGSGPLTIYYWLGGVFIDSPEVAALGKAFQGTSETTSWFFPIRRDLTAAQVPPLEADFLHYSGSISPRHAELTAGAGILQDNEVTVGLIQGLAAFDAQWHTVEQSDSLLLVGLFVAGAMLLFVCAELAVEAYKPELLIIRVRGGSLRQLVRLMLTRSCLIALLPVLAGSAAAIALLPSAAGTTSWILGILTAIAAIGSLPAIAFALNRDKRLGSGSRIDEVVAAKPRFRRLVAELGIVLIAAAAIADLRLRGTGSSTSSYLSASAVLIAAAVGIIVNRAYRGPLRAAARVAGTMKGPVAAVGLTRVALSRISSVAPALVLMLTLTLVAFAGMVMSAVGTGQVAASWASVGADAQIVVPGLKGHHIVGVTQAELNAVSAISGVRHDTAIYTASSDSSLAVQLDSGTVGIAVVDPAPYGALSQDTPWPDFPVAAMSRPVAGTRGVVPILASPQAAASAAGHAAPRLNVAGISIPVKIIGTVTDSPAMPQGGSYIVLPRWAAHRLPSLPQPGQILATGAHLSGRQLQAAVGRGLPLSSTIFLRASILRALVRSPALHLSRSLYVSGALAAAALSLLAVLFALASSARSRSIMMMKLTALGMTRAQALAVSLTDAVPLLAVAAIGSAASGWLLAVILRPVLGLAVFTNSVVPVTLEPTWLAVAAPIAATAAVAVTFLAVESAWRGRRNIGTIIRLQEAT